MRNLNDWLVLVFWSALGAFAIVFAFYLASILIPVLLLIIAVSGLASFIVSLIRRNQQEASVNVRIAKTTSRNKHNIIDAEYEIIDDK